MSITFRCPGCHQRYTTPDSMAGMSTPCKKCGIAVVIPSPASAAAPPVSPSPPAQVGPRDLSDLLEDAAASSTLLAPAESTLAPLRRVAPRVARVGSGFEWQTFLKGVVLTRVGIAFLTAVAGLVIYLLMLLVAPATAGTWARVCALVAMVMGLAGYVWLLCVFFPRASETDVFVLIVLPICSVALNIVVSLNVRSIVGFLGPNLTLTVAALWGLGNLLIFLYGLVWIGMHWRPARRSASVWALGVVMLCGASLGVQRGEDRQAGQEIADDAAWGRADARPEVAQFVPRPAPRPADFVPPPQPFSDLATHPAPGPDRPAAGLNPPQTRPMDNPAAPIQIPGPAIGPGPGRLVPDRFGPRVRPGRPGFGPRGLQGARRGRPTDLLGGSGGGSFETAGSGDPVLGFDYRLGSWAGQQAIGDLRPLFARAGQGIQPPFARGPQGAQQVMARDGYAVGALEVDAAEFVNAVRVVFMRVDAQGRLDPNDSYKSDWIGAVSGRPTQTLGGDGSKIIGIYGRRTAVLDAVGLLLE